MFLFPNLCTVCIHKGDMSSRDRGTPMHVNAVHEAGPFLVIGACGFLGSHICRTLHSQGRKTVVLVRSSNLNPQISMIPLTVKISPVIDEDVLNDVLFEVCKGYIAGIFHVAGCVKHTTNSADVAEMRLANVDLSSIIFEFATKHGIRVVYASSSGVVGCQFLEDKLRVAHDDSPLCTSSSDMFPYYKQKSEVELLWRPRALQCQAPIIFLRPSLLLGPGDERLSSTQIVLQLIRKKVPFLVQGGISFVDVRDVAAAFIEAMLSGEVTLGTAMNLTAANCSIREFAELVAKYTGVPAPSFALPSSVARIGGRLLNTYHELMQEGKDSLTDPVVVEMGQRYWNVSCQRAVDLIDFEPRECRETIVDTAQYLYNTFGEGDAVQSPVQQNSCEGHSSERWKAAGRKRPSTPFFRRGNIVRLLCFLLVVVLCVAMLLL